MTVREFAPDCPSNDELLAFSTGRLDSPLFEAVSEHFGRCSTCQDAMATLSSEIDSVIISLRKPLPACYAFDEPELQELEGLARRLVPEWVDTQPWRPGDPAFQSQAATAEEALPRDLGQYRLIAKLGQGGMGVVYKGLHVNLKRQVAIKVLPSLRMPQAVQRFYREMEAVGKLDHQHVIRATDAGEIAGCHYLVMEYVEGVDLSRVVRRLGRLSVPDACEIVRQTALGLDYIGNKGFSHRDIKPSNLFLTNNGVVKILDLGLARVLTEQLGENELTGSGNVLGTLDYMSPEQATDPRLVDIRSDIYSLGCTLYKLLAGKAPFAGSKYEGNARKILAHCRDIAPPIEEHAQDIPASLVAVLNKMLAKEPVDRFRRPAEVAEQLAPLAAGADLMQAVQMAVDKDASEQEPIEVERDTWSGSAHDTPPPRAHLHGENRLQAVARSCKRLATKRPFAFFIAAGILGVACVVAFGLSSTFDDRADLLEGLNLFSKSPEVLVWPTHLASARWNFNTRKQVLQSDCPGVGLLGLSKGVQPPYSFRIRIEQARWVGGAGIFVGYRRDQGRGRPLVKYQLIELFSTGHPDPNKAFALRRILVVDELKLGAAPIRKTNLAQVGLPMPDARPYELEIVVDKTGLRKIRWDGKDLAGLAGRDVNARVTPADYLGVVGVFCEQSSTTFSDARLGLIEE